jgi:FkbM family methyltransferase
MSVPAGLHVRHERIDGIGPWLWPAKDYWAWEHPRSSWHGLRDLIVKHAKRRRHIVQAGGCCGMYPRLWSDHFDHVTTFEPDSLNFYCLSANCPGDNIVKLQAALSDSAAAVSIEGGKDFNVGLGRVAPAPGFIPALRLDDFKFDCLDAIQLDCEGHEAKVLAGAQATIFAHRPVISVENPDDAVRGLLSGYVEAGRVTTMQGVVDVVFALVT